ncbi:hypothetical protein N7493_001748 [Penicillium malachiteum]|uniref:Rhodopsin domain-containing protein n=1 Tax=Penicillium malachiteum TaxID=1324776 RepID=A0AAD6HVI6_9EURO|nr:hypothetical protein N7493_001748 [Penicillium malachiteum]
MTITYPLTTPLSRNPIIAVTVLGAVATITTGLRFWALKLRRVSPGLPEFLILGALMILPLETLYGIVLALVKTSIMAFYIRIFGSNRSFRIQVAITMTIVWMWTASVILETFLLCRPLKYNWDTSISGVCGDRNAAYVVAGTMNLITDLMVMALPMPHIWKLQLGTAKKVALSGVFSIGLLVSIISIVRLVALMAINFTNITGSVQMAVMWTVIEPELAIICANMPLMKTIIARVAPNLFSTGKARYGVSDPQTFERLQDSQRNNIYPMNRLDHEPIRTHISTTNGGESQRNLAGHETNTYVTSHDTGESHSNLSVTPPGTINVMHDFSIQHL